MSQFNTMSLPIQRIEGKPNCATTPNPPLANNHWKVKLLYNYIPVTVYTFQNSKTLANLCFWYILFLSCWSRQECTAVLIDLLKNDG